MKITGRTFAMRIAVTAAAAVMSAVSAQTPDAESMQRTADLVNLMRTILDPAPAPVLVSPAERAVSGKTSADPASPVVAATPVVILPDIVLPDSETDAPEELVKVTEAPAQSAAKATAARKKDAADTDSDPDEYPPFSYVFFFGEYVPYYNGWFYYSDAWLWGRRLPRPAEPPHWIPPPPPPRPLDPLRPHIGPGPGPVIIDNRGGSFSGGSVRTGSFSTSAQRIVRPKEPGSTIPVVPNLHRVPRKVETQVEPREQNTNIPVSPSLHRIQSKAASQNLFPEKNDSVPVSASQHRIPSKAASQNRSAGQSNTVPVAPGAHRISRGNR